MDKMKMESVNLTEQNIDKIAALFPNVITEATDENGELKKAINFELLKQVLSADVLDGDEAYEFTWVGKKAAIVEAGKPIRKTLRPCKEESKDWDTTKNLYIEGDNLDALKLLQESYLGKIKIIYIDPPYNTGNDFVYCDDFKVSKDQYDEDSGVYNDEGDRLFRNTKSNGRFHSDWCSMIYPRLQLARNLLKENGIIFISIDDNEVASLRKICDEIFGKENFVAELIWHLSSGPQAGHFTRSSESILVFSKNKFTLPYFKAVQGGSIIHGALKKISSANPASEIIFPKNSITCEIKDVEFGKELGGSEKQYVTKGVLKFVNGVLVNDVTIKAGWGMKNQILSWLKGVGTFDSKGQKVVKFYFNSQGILFYEKERGTYHPKTVISSTEVGGTRAGGDEIISLFGEKIMSFPKPSKLIEFLANLVSDSDDIILDFFSGSATTAHAVMKLNQKDGGNRRFIMVQLPEECPAESEAAKAGYKNICEIGKERIRRAGEKIKAEAGLTVQKLDIGFRVFKLDSTNMKDVYYGASEYNQGMLSQLESNIKEDRTDLDLLYSCLLEWGLPLSLPHKSEEIGGVTVHTINDGDLIACFAEKVNDTVVKEIAIRKPLRVVFRDSSFASSPEKINVEEIFKLMAPNTTVKVL